MLNTSFSPWPSFTEEEAAAIQKILLSNQVNYWTGNECRLFEKEFAAYIEVPYAVSLSNGTVALDVALKALKIGVGDEVIVTSRSFIASASCIRMAGATPIFADVDDQSQNITAETIRPCITEKTRAIICVHLAGWPCDMDPIMALAKAHGLFVIEDCAQAHGAMYKNRPVGSIGDIGAWSFCQDKIMTTGGEGGMVTTKDRQLYEFMWSYKDHGKARERLDSAPGIEFQWMHTQAGTNGRMIEIQAGIGRIQLRRMPIWHTRRLQYAQQIWSIARTLKGLRVPDLPASIEHAAYKCYVFVKPEYLAHGWTRNRIIQAIREQGVPCYPGSCSEIYLEQVFDGSDSRPKKRLPIAQKLGETSLMFLVHPTLSQQEIEKTSQVLTAVMREATCASPHTVMNAEFERVE